MQIRRYRPADAAACAQVFHDAVQIAAAGAYDRAQRDAWSPRVPDADAWAARLAGLDTWVAQDHAIAGFMSLRADGYVDFAFVRPDKIGQGVGLSLYHAVEDHGRAQGLIRLTTAVSHLAKPFFLRQGWVVERGNTIERAGVTLENWLMHKELTKAHHD